MGTWTPGFPSAFNLNADMEDKLVLRKTRDVLRVVSVIQPPFMEWNEEKGINIYTLNQSDMTCVYRVL